MVIANSGLATVELLVDTGAGYTTSTMFDDGMHHDGAASDGLFGVALAPMPEGTEVAYYLEAEDLSAEIVNDPIYAPTIAIYRYEVGPAIWICGDVDNSGGEPDISDLIYPVSFMFQDGPDLIC